MLEVEIRWQVEGFELDVAFAAERDRCGLLGPSGGGKTSLLRVVAGLEERAEGRVAFRGRTWQEPDATFVEPWDRDVAWLPQDALVFPHLDAEENLRYAAPPESDFTDVVEAFEIGDRLDASASALSGGEAQRIALGRAVLADPELLLLDEPFSALDRRLTERISEFLDDWCEERGTGLVVAAHHESTVDDLVASTFRIQEGRLVD